MNQWLMEEYGQEMSEMVSQDKHMDQTKAEQRGTRETNMNKISMNFQIKEEKD
jgi:hypothetical protein